MTVDPLACTILAAASLSTGMRRAIVKQGRDVPAAIPQSGLSALAAAHQQARSLNIPESAITGQLDRARKRGQPDLAALNELITEARRLNKGR